jgi:hypothetical protein
MPFPFRHLIRVISLAVLVLILTSPAIAAANDYDQTIRQAMNSLTALEYDRAATELEQAIQIQPSEPPGLSLSG